MNTHTRTRFGRPAAYAALVSASLLAITGCAAGAPDSTNTSAAPVELDIVTTTPAATGPIDKVTWRLVGEPASLDYARAFAGPENAVVANVCESLIEVNADFTTSPGLAESWESPDPSTWIFNLREGVTFHDGTPLTSADAVASLQRHFDPATGSPWAGFMPNVDTIEATGDLQVTVKMSEPDALFGSMMSTQAGAIESAATLAAAGGDYGTSQSLPNCTGPFEVESWTPGEAVNLVKAPDYWDAENAAQAESFEFRFIGDANTMVSALQTGEIDGSWDVPVIAREQLLASGAGKLYFGEDTTTFQMIITDSDGPLSNPVVRQALTQATNRAGIVAAAEKGYATVANGPIPPSVWADADPAFVDDLYASLDQYPYDIEAAKKRIEGIDLGGETIRIAIPNGREDARIIAQEIQSGAQALGMTAEIEVIGNDEFGAFFAADSAARDPFDMFWTSWVLEVGTPTHMIPQLGSDAGTNYGGYSSPELDTLIADIRASTDAETTTELAADATRLLNEELPWLPMYTNNNQVWMNNRITGVAPSIAYLYRPWAAAIGASGE